MQKEKKPIDKEKMLHEGIIVTAFFMAVLIGNYAYYNGFIGIIPYILSSPVLILISVVAILHWLTVAHRYFKQQKTKISS